MLTAVLALLAVQSLQPARPWVQLRTAQAPRLWSLSMQEAGASGSMWEEDERVAPVVTGVSQTLAQLPSHLASQLASRSACSRPASFCAVHVHVRECVTDSVRTRNVLRRSLRLRRSRSRSLRHSLRHSLRFPRPLAAGARHDGDALADLQGAGLEIGAG